MFSAFTMAAVGGTMRKIPLISRNQPPCKVGAIGLFVFMPMNVRVYTFFQLCVAP